MVKFSDLLVEKSQHGLTWNIFAASLIMFDVIYPIKLVTLPIDDVKSFLQLIDIQMYVKLRISIKIRFIGNCYVLLKMAESS